MITILYISELVRFFIQQFFSILMIKLHEQQNIVMKEL